MKFVLIGLLMFGCGTQTIKVKGGSTHTVDGAAKQEIVITIDVSGCLSVPAEQRLECVKSLVEVIKELENVAKILSCKGSFIENPGSAGADPYITCRGESTVEGDGSYPQG